VAFLQVANAVVVRLSRLVCLPLLFFLFTHAAACGRSGQQPTHPADEIGDTGTGGDTGAGSDTGAGGDTGTTPIEPQSCDGVCVTVPPATYTGPSFFSLTPPAMIPDCPPDTSYQGLQGMVQGVMLPLVARECRITPKPTCDKEGRTCSPYPPPDYRICIHHDGKRPCDEVGGYDEAVTMVQDGTASAVTLCCMKPSGPG
jgi:hypothetical protein